MRIFQAVGGLFLVIGVLVVVVTIVPLLGLFGDGGFGGFGGFGLMAAVPGIVFTLVPIGIVFLVIANVLRAVSGPSAAGIAGAVPGTATVRASSATGMRVNRQPVVRVDLDLAVPGRASVPVSVRRVVPPEHLHVIRPGAVLPAMVDPADPRRFAIDWDRVGLGEGTVDQLGPGSTDLSGVAELLKRVGIRLDPALLGGATAMRVDGPTVIDVTPGAGALDAPEPVPPSQLLGTPAVPGGGMASPAGAAGGPTGGAGMAANVDVTGATLSALRATGEAARGIIREASDLGIAIGDGRLYRLRLDIVTGSRPGFTTEQVALVPAGSLWRMVTGVTLPLFLDRTEPNRLAIDWEA